MRKNLIVKQDGYKECGAACLLSIIRYYGGNMSMSLLAEFTHTDKAGTNFYQLKLASQEIGMDAVGYKVSELSSLMYVDRPCICQIIDNNYEHFVVIYKCKKKNITIMDPASGMREVDIDLFSKLWTGYIMIFSPRKKLALYQEERYMNKIIKDTIQKNKSIVLNILLLSLIFTILSCVYTLYFQVVLDRILDTTKNNLLFITFIFGIILIVKCLSGFFRNELLIILNEKIDCSIFLNTFKKLLLLPYNYYKNRTTGEVVSRINDLIYVKNILNKIILTVFLDFIIFFCSGIYLFYINRVMFLFLLIIIMIYIVIFYIFRPVLKRYTNINQENTAMVNSLLIETISGFETIKNIHTEKKFLRLMKEKYTEALGDSFNYENISNLELFLKDILFLLGILLVELLGFKMVMDGRMTLGSVLTFTFMANYFMEPIKNILDLNKEYFYAVNSLKRVNRLFEVKVEEFGTISNFSIKGNIMFNDLIFSYNGENNILNHLSLYIGEHEKVMVLGKSGSGKSTILKLLLKYYEVGRNSIYIDNVDLNDYSITDIRNNISCMSQNEILFTDTIKNNITMYEDIGDYEFLEVCRVTHVDDFVKNLFLGYETKLEENGLNLSGGQRQRIMLARMLIQKRKIILIDEGLNAMDIHLEREILQGIFSKYVDHTIIIVSHRKENMDLFDKVITLENGCERIDNNYLLEESYD